MDPDTTKRVKRFLPNSFERQTLRPEVPSDTLETRGWRPVRRASGGQLFTATWPTSRYPDRPT